MPRERKGFIVSRVQASIEYRYADGQPPRILQNVNVNNQPAGPKHKLTDAQKHELKVKRAKELIHQTITVLKHEGATKCKGSIDSRLHARVGYTDEKGKRHDRWRAASSLTHGRELIKEMLRDLDDRGDRALDAARMTFLDLAIYFGKHYLKPAEYVDGRKIVRLTNKTVKDWPCCARCLTQGEDNR